MARILITGGSGFIGAGVARALARRGDEVVVLDIARSRALESVVTDHPGVAFVGGTRQSDDIAILAIRYDGNPAA